MWGHRQGEIEIYVKLDQSALQSDIRGRNWGSVAASGTHVCLCTMIFKLHVARLHTPHWQGIYSC